MKYLLMMLIAFGSCFALSAQQIDRDNYRKEYFRDNDDRRMDWHIAEINRDYDHRIWEVKNDYSLSEHRKRKMIREINEEREDRLKAARKWERKEDRREERLERKGEF